MNVAVADAYIESLRQSGLHADAHLQEKVLVGRTRRKYLLVENDHPALDNKVGLDGFLAPPHHA